MGKMILNGKEYAGSGSEWNEYSNEEKVVGKWIDGKPVYELIVHSSGLAPEVNVETNIADLSAYNIDTIISLQAIDRWQRASGNIDMSVPNGDYFLPFYRYTTKYLMFRQSYAGSATNDMYIVLRYTKTTD